MFKWSLRDIKTDVFRESFYGIQQLSTLVYPQVFNDVNKILNQQQELIVTNETTTSEESNFKKTNNEGTVFSWERLLNCNILEKAPSQNTSS